MLYYALIGLCLVLTGVAGLQMAYMFYLDRLDKERKRRIRQLERRCRALSARLERAEERMAEQDALLGAFGAAPEHEDNWADVIE